MFKLFKAFYHPATPDSFESKVPEIRGQKSEVGVQNCFNDLNDFNVLDERSDRTSEAWFRDRTNIVIEPAELKK